jgi:hypothetical protein
MLCVSPAETSATDESCAGAEDVSGTEASKPASDASAPPRPPSSVGTPESKDEPDPDDEHAGASDTSDTSDNRAPTTVTGSRRWVRPTSIIGVVSF